MAEAGQVGELLGALRGFAQEGLEGFGEGVGVETGLEELGDDAAAGDEVGHGDGEVAFAVVACAGGVHGPDFGRVPDELPGELEGEGGDAVDDDEGVADERGLDGGGSGRNDGGAGMMEGFAGVGDEVDVGQGEGRVGTRVVGDPAGNEVCQAGAVDGAGYGEDVFDGLSVGGGVAAGHLDHGGEVGFDLAPAGAGEEGDPGFGGVEVVVRGVGFAGDAGQWKRGEGVAHEESVDVAVGIERGFEREDDEHFGDALLDPAEAAPLPGPELGGDEPDDGNVAAFELAGEAEVDVGEIDEDGGGGGGSVDAADEFAVLGVDVGGVAKDLGDAHVGDVLCADDAGLSGLLHEEAAEAGEGGGGELLFEGRDELGAVEIARGLAGGEEEVRIGRGGDGGLLR